MRARFGGLPAATEAEQIWRDIWYEEAHNSTAIEGNTLARSEVETLLRTGKTVGNKQLKDYLEVRGYADAAKWVYGQALGSDEGWQGNKLVTLAEVREVHRIALTPAWEFEAPDHALPEESPGNWRRHEIEPFVSGMTPPAWTDVPSQITDWVDSAAELERDDPNLFERIAEVHAEFERIHPFLEGNGRTGRLLLNLILVRLGYPPAVIYFKDRPRYLDALAKADRADAAPLGEMLVRAIHNNLLRLVYPAIAGEVKLVPLEALATSKASVVALRQAAQRGRLQAIQGPDRVWRSTKKWVVEYIDSRYASLRRPKQSQAAAAYRASVDASGPVDSGTSAPYVTKTVTKGS
jgi:hypothetical protein